MARPHALLPGPPDVLVSGFVEDDGSRVDQVALGRLLRWLHDLPLPSPAQTVAGARESFPRVLVDRLIRRWGVVRATVPSLPELPAADRLLDALQGRPTDALLHLDVRRDNLRAVDGEVLALLDWSNALVGDPDLELCRLAEYARLPENGLELDQVLTGYGQSDAVRTPWSWIYRLDAAVMLAVVFLHEAPDPPRARSQVERLLVLREQGLTRQRHPRR